MAAACRPFRPPKRRGKPRPCGDAVLQRLPLQELHHDEGLALVFIDVVNRADVGMIQRGGSPRLALEAFQRLAVLAEMFGQELQCDKTGELDVLGFVDHAHATGAQLLDDPVVRYRRANHAKGVQPLRIILRCCDGHINCGAGKEPVAVLVTWGFQALVEIQLI